MEYNILRVLIFKSSYTFEHPLHLSSNCTHNSKHKMKKHNKCHRMSNFYAVETAVSEVPLECNTNIQETKHIYN